MAFAATDLSSEKRSFSLGPVKMQVFTYTVGTGITTGTITADNLIGALGVMIDGSLVQTSAATFSGNVVTLAFADPAATVYGTAIVFGY